MIIINFSKTNDSLKSRYKLPTQKKFEILRFEA